MNTPSRVLSIILSLLAASPWTLSQEITLRGRSGLEFSLGLWGGAKASNAFTSTGIRQEAVTSGFSGGLLYSYGMKEHLAATLSLGFLGGEASSTVSGSTVQQQASSIVPILVGMRYYVAEPTAEDRVRLFLSAAVGSFLGFEASNTTLGQEARSESTFGGKAGAGIDFFLNTHFKLLVTAGYNLMSDFKTPIGARVNYNAGEFALAFGYVF
jgi:hypothetical protein